MTEKGTIMNREQFKKLCEENLSGDLYQFLGIYYIDPLFDDGTYFEIGENINSTEVRLYEKVIPCNNYKDYLLDSTIKLADSWTKDLREAIIHIREAEMNNLKED